MRRGALRVSTYGLEEALGTLASLCPIGPREKNVVIPLRKSTVQITWAILARRRGEAVSLFLSRSLAPCVRTQEGPAVSIVIHELRGSPSSVQDPAQLGTVGARRFRPLPELSLCREEPRWRVPNALLWATQSLSTESCLNYLMDTTQWKIRHIEKALGTWLSTRWGRSTCLMKCGTT